MLIVCNRLTHETEERRRCAFWHCRKEAERKRLEELERLRQIEEAKEAERRRVQEERERARRESEKQRLVAQLSAERLRERQMLEQTKQSQANVKSTIENTVRGPLFSLLAHRSVCAPARSPLWLCYARADCAQGGPRAAPGNRPPECHRVLERDRPDAHHPRHARARHRGASARLFGSRPDHSLLPAYCSRFLCSTCAQMCLCPVRYSRNFTRNCASSRR